MNTINTASLSLYSKYLIKYKGQITTAKLIFIDHRLKAYQFDFKSPVTGFKIVPFIALKDIREQVTTNLQPLN
jgi:hypothetical protein